MATMQQGCFLKLAFPVDGLQKLAEHPVSY